MPDLHIQPQTTFRDIQQNFEGLSPKLGEKHLRLDEGRGLHLHDSGKWSGIGAKAAERRAAKHEGAFEMVMRSIDEQLGRHGVGEHILRNVLTPEQFDKKLIAVDDLARIGQMVEQETGRDRQAIQIAEQLGRKIGDPKIARDIMNLVMLDRSIDLDKLQQLAEGPDTYALVTLDKEALRQDLREMGVMQALARHGVIPSDITQGKFGIKTLIATGSDVQAFGSQGLRQIEKERAVYVQGTRWQMEDLPMFSVCRSHGLKDRIDEGSVSKTGDKVHLSIDPYQVDQAWDLLLPIFEKYGDVLEEFKVTKMATARKEVQDLQARLERDGALHPDDQEALKAALRILEGAQITLYRHIKATQTPEQVERFSALVREATQALRGAGIPPGTRPESDLAVNEFCSFRNELREDGSTIDTRAPDYGQHKTTFEGRPLFQALTA